MRAVASVFLLSVVPLGSPTAFAQNDEAPRKTIRRIVEEIELVPSLYARGEGATRTKRLPKFSIVKLVGYHALKQRTPETERVVWMKNPETYAKDAPLRAAIFVALDAMEKINTTELPLTLDAKQLLPGLFKDGKVEFSLMVVSQIGSGCAGPRSFLTPHVYPRYDQTAARAGEAMIRFHQSITQATIELEKAHAQMMNASEHRDKEVSKRWRADFDFAAARVETNLLFLYEYNYQIGIARADALPQLGGGDRGWQIAFVPKVTVTEKRAKDLVKSRLKRLQAIEEEHPGTPWAFFAQRERERSVGMLWQTRRQ